MRCALTPRHRIALDHKRLTVRAGLTVLILLASPGSAPAAPAQSPAPSQSHADIDLVSLIETPGVSGYEEDVRAAIVAALPTWANARVDSSGNLLVVIGSGSPHLLIATGISEAGYVISDVSEEGYARVHRQTPAVGALFDQFFYGRPVQIQTGDGSRIAAVSATRSTHLSRDAPRDSRNDIRGLNDLVIDLGAQSSAEVKSLGVRLMDPVTLRDRVQTMADGRIAGVGAQARAAAAALLLLPEKLQGRTGRGTVTLAWSAEATTGYRGLRRLARETRPDRVILATFGRAAAPLDRRGQIGSLGGGPLIDTADPWLAEIAAAACVAVQPVSAEHLVDAGGARRIWSDIPLHLVALPTRYVGTPVETVTSADVGLLAELLTAAAGPADSAGSQAPAPRQTLPPRQPQIEMNGSLARLERLIETYGPSGHEQSVRAALERMLPAWAQPEVDSAGNLSVTFGSGKRHFVFVAHLDEVGFEVTGVASDGSVGLRRLGGFIEAVYEASPAYVLTAGGPVAGILAPRAGYLEADTLNPPRGSRIRMDLGTESQAATTALGVAVGDAVTIRKRLQALAGTRLTGRSIDDRVGSAALALALQRLDPGDLDDRRVTFAWSTGEEIGLLGAAVLAERTRPDVVFAVDTFVSSDSPVDWQRRARVPIGSGLVARVLDNNHVSPRSAVDRVLAIAARHGIPMTPGSTGGGTDAGAFSEWGAIPMPISWPARYSHSPVELIDGRDFDRLIDLLVALVREY